MCVHRANVGAGGKPRCITPPVQVAQGRPLVMLLPRAGVNNWLVVMGGRTAELGWFGTRTDTFHNDVALVTCEAGALQWRTPPIAGEAPTPREFPTLAALSGGRLLLFGGDLPCSFVAFSPIFKLIVSMPCTVNGEVSRPCCGQLSMSSSCGAACPAEGELSIQLPCGGGGDFSHLLQRSSSLSTCAGIGKFFMKGSDSEILSFILLM